MRFGSRDSSEFWEAIRLNLVPWEQGYGRLGRVTYKEEPVVDPGERPGGPRPPLICGSN